MAKSFSWKTKQRVVVRSEPQLGIGSIEKIDLKNNFLKIHFPLVELSRQYSLNNNSLQRYKLSPGDLAQSKENHQLSLQFIVQTIEEHSGLFIYLGKIEGEIVQLSEVDLDARNKDPGTQDQFFAGLWSHHQTYDLRQNAWKIRSQIKQSPVRGLVGPKVTPMAHQLYVAKTVAHYPHPRVLLADEVGLGKTIEAGLIFNNLKSSGRAERVLIVTPQSLTHQWLSEMFRRFNELFTVMDKERHQEEIEQADNPFLNSQKILCPIDTLLSPEIFEQALNGNWDLIIVDEAHRLSWSPTTPSKKWQKIKTLAQKSQGILLLTATPQLHGLESQFGLLNIVDPQRFSDFKKFKEESKNLKSTSKIAQSIQEGSIEEKHLKELKDLFKNDDEIQSLCQKKPQDISQDHLIQLLIDRHGTGRVLFRNRRKRLKGFPKRTLVPHNLDLQKNSPEKTKLTWLEKFLKENTDKKILLLCSSRETVIQTASFLKKKLFNPSIFHEELSIIERDVQAAQFAQDPSKQILLCSEIGGEGRNFQFVQNMILFDLPHHPDTLEQRIGRLDRIGQKEEIFIHVPKLQNSPEEILFQWYHQGLNAFESSWNGAGDIFNEFEDQIKKLSEKPLVENDLETLIKETQKSVEKRKDFIEKNIDTLIDLNSFNEDQGQKLIDEVDDIEDNPELELFIKDLFNHYGVHYRDYDDHGTLLIRPSELTFIDNFPGLKKHEDTLFTFDRSTALKREDMVFLTQDHPITEEILNMLLDRNEGAASLCQWPDSPMGQGVLVEMTYILEPSGPQNLELETYMPIQIKETQINHLGEKKSENRHKETPSLLEPLKDSELPENLEGYRDSLEPLIRKTTEEINQWAQLEIDQFYQKTQKQLQQEMDRAVYLSKTNRNITNQELQEIQNRHEKTLSCLKASTGRLDSIRLIFTH